MELGARSQEIEVGRWELGAQSMDMKTSALDVERWTLSVGRLLLNLG